MKYLWGVLVFLCFSGTLGSEEFKTTKIAGWSVLASPQVDKVHLEVLEATLKELNDLFPKKLLTVIQRVPIQIDGKDDNQKDGNLEKGRYEAKRIVRDGIDRPLGVGKIHIYSARDCGNRNLLIHELSHAAQNLTIGNEDARVKKAYNEVVIKELYPKDCYLMKNHLEYFAEMSVVYLSKLHYFPHDRDTLKKHDPMTYQLMEDFWESKMQKRR